MFALSDFLVKWDFWGVASLCGLKLLIHIALILWWWLFFTLANGLSHSWTPLIVWAILVPGDCLPQLLCMHQVQGGMHERGLSKHERISLAIWSTGLCQEQYRSAPAFQASNNFLRLGNEPPIEARVITRQTFPETLNLRPILSFPYPSKIRTSSVTPELFKSFIMRCRAEWDRMVCVGTNFPALKVARARQIALLTVSFVLHPLLESGRSAGNNQASDDRGHAHVSLKLLVPRTPLPRFRWTETPWSRSWRRMGRKLLNIFLYTVGCRFIAPREPLTHTHTQREHMCIYIYRYKHIYICTGLVLE